MDNKNSDENISKRIINSNNELREGDISEGIVAKITNFGVFVDLPTNERGFVHISEVSQRYIKDINECLSVNQKIKVKVLSIKPDGKISLSIKCCENNSYDNNGYNSRKNNKNNSFDKNQNFEKMMSTFKKVSEDKISDLNSRKPLKASKSRRQKF